MRFSVAASLALSCALSFVACDIPPEPVDEADMKEQELQIEKIFYIENKKEFFMDYDPNDYRYSSYRFYEDYDGHVPFNPIDYVTNLNPSKFSPLGTDTYRLFSAIYSGATESLTTIAELNNEKFVYIYTEEEGSGGIPGLGPVTKWVATGKARIRASTEPIHILRSADSMITIESQAAQPSGLPLTDIVYAEKDLLLFATDTRQGGVT